MVVAKYAKWREGMSSLFHGADAQKVADELEQIGDDNLTPSQIVDAARNPETELHKCFEWNDAIAAEKYRERQARCIMHNLVFIEQEIPKDRPEIRVHYCPQMGKGYVQTKKIVRNEDSYKKLLEMAWAELRAFKIKYGMLEELKEIMDLID